MIEDNRFIATLTVDELRGLIRELQSEKNQDSTSTTHHLVYGLRGIQSLFNCSHKQAQYYKDHVIQEAVSQNGRKIVVDAGLALKIFNKKVNNDC